MRPDIKINGISMASLGWLRENVSFPTPVAQSNTIVVPGRNTPIRYTEALGRVSFEPRSFQMIFTMHGSRDKYNEMVSEASNMFNGVLSEVITSEEPTLYMVGTLKVTPSYDPMTKKGTVEISCEDGDSYRYYVEETVVSYTGGGKVTLENDYMPVVPTVTVTAETTLSWKVGSDSFNKTVNKGTWTFPEMELGRGENTLTISGTGTTTFRYREGCL